MDVPCTVRRMRHSRFLANLRFRLWMFWWRTNKSAWAFALVLGTVVAALGFALQGAFVYKDEKLAAVRETHQRNLTCLARNVYFEARGEPLAGQYAVAEVTMNRKASRLFPRTICEVVYQKSAFSWTELEPLPEPSGESWEQAWQVAEAVYYQRQPPVLHGALFYHATYIKPEWAREKKRVAQIGQHVFYR